MKNIWRWSIISPSFWSLLAGNVFCFIYFKEYEADFTTIIWIYWCHSVCIGLVSALELYLPDANPDAVAKDTGLKLNGSNGCLSLFFLMHYGAFHLVYAVFISMDYGGAVNREVLLLALSAFIAEIIISFFQRRKASTDGITNTGATMFLPYLRVFPMHLTIILPALLDIEATQIFILVKTLADLLGWMIFQAIFYKKQAVANS